MPAIGYRLRRLKPPFGLPSPYGSERGTTTVHPTPLPTRPAPRDCHAPGQFPPPADWPSALAGVHAALTEIKAKLTTQVKGTLNVAEVAACVCCSELTVRRWIKEGKIAALKVAGDGPRGRWLVPRAELAKLIAHGLAGDLPDAYGSDEPSPHATPGRPRLPAVSS